MTTQELHIGIDLELQELNTQAKKGLLPQEKDWFLNREIDNFINSRLPKDADIKRRGFQNNIEVLEDIDELINKSGMIPITNNSLVLPYDCLKYINAEVYLSKNCNKESINKTIKSYYKTVFSIDYTIDNLSNYKINIASSQGVSTVFNISTLPTNYINNLEFRKQKFLLIKALKIKLKESIDKTLNSNTQLYWERYGEEYYPMSFILISEVVVNSVNVEINSTANIYESTNYSSIFYDESQLLAVPLRIVNQEFEPEIRHSNLSKSSIESIVATYRKNSLHIQVPNDVVVRGAKINYVLQPRLVDLLLNSNSELSSSTLKKIVSNTTQFLKALLTDDNYEAYARENILIE